MTSRLALGTAQFGMVYGINNKTGQVSGGEAHKTLLRGASAGVDTIDTAQAYGESEKVLGHILPDIPYKFRIISKFIASAGTSPRVALDTSLKNLGQDSLYGLLYHKFSDLKEFPDWHSRLLELKSEGLVSRVGFSLYSPSELDLLLDNGIVFDMLQIPYSVFDRRFEPYFEMLRDRGVELYVRSVFLQGLVFMSPENLTPHLAPMAGRIALLRKLASEHRIPVSALCICFSAGNKNVERAVIGVDGSADLEENIAALAYQSAVNGLRAELAPLAETDENLILPMNWRR